MTQACEITWTDKEGEHKVVITAESLKLFEDIASFYRESHTHPVPHGANLVFQLNQMLAGTSRKIERYLDGKLHDSVGTPAVEQIEIVDRDLSQKKEPFKTAIVTHERYQNGKRQNFAIRRSLWTEAFDGKMPAVMKYDCDGDPHILTGGLNKKVLAVSYFEKNKHKKTLTVVEVNALNKKIDQQNEKIRRATTKNSGDIEIVEYLLEKGAQIEEEKQKMKTASAEKVFGQGFKFKM